MNKQTRLRIAIQKKGRLNSESMDLLQRCGLQMRMNANSLFFHCENLPIDILLVRDDDIPTLIMGNTCDVGIIGENVLLENALAEKSQSENKYELVKKLGFCHCRLSIAIPHDKPFAGPQSLDTKRIATSYPNLLKNYLAQNQISAQIMQISGSVEIAPRLDMADAICDLVSTGRTLEENNLIEVAQVIQCEAVLIKSREEFTPEKYQTFQLLLQRICGVLKAKESKYIMFHLPKPALPLIKELLPGSESPTILPLESMSDKVAVHVVSSEGVFWSTLERLKEIGASSILVIPIEKMLS
jgi:ATP phosphoribosyltransferase